MYKKYFKRVIDFVFALMGLVILSPIFIITFFLLSFVNEGRPFFFQIRPGFNEKLFKIVKFKTMTDEKDKNGNLLPDADRMTKIGGFVRKTSLDEIPQLLNVLKGDMSLIGPRPLLPEYLPLYTNEQKKRHQVKPGITGLAQVKGRNLMKFSERLINDIYYVQNISFKLDFKILIKTIGAVFFGKNTIVNGQTVDDVDDIGLSKGLSSNHFKNK
jgi:undecaprenyl phosphate N,N'-diacetylbacillosamine 1-phosphate transferase